jgi:RimJ/RimL family protein N-acetyltransferase
MGVSLARTNLYRLTKSSDLPRAEPNCNINWALLAPENVRTLTEIGPFDLNECSHRLQRGDLCYLAFLGDRLAHYSWVQRSGSHPITRAGVSVPVGSDEFWIYSCRTAEHARGKGIYPATLERIINDHFEQGYRNARIYASRENVASQKGILRAGFRLVAKFTAFRFGSHYYSIGLRIKASNFL